MDSKVIKAYLDSRLKLVNETLNDEKAEAYKKHACEYRKAEIVEMLAFIETCMEYDRENESVSNEEKLQRIYHKAYLAKGLLATGSTLILSGKVSDRTNGDSLVYEALHGLLLTIEKTQFGEEE
nr:MAG TPA: hypothetical protein [Caudoviricetes sp.]